MWLLRFLCISARSDHECCQAPRRRLSCHLLEQMGGFEICLHCEVQRDCSTAIVVVLLWQRLPTETLPSKLGKCTKQGMEEVEKAWCLCSFSAKRFEMAELGRGLVACSSGRVRPRTCGVVPQWEVAKHRSR